MQQGETQYDQKQHAESDREKHRVSVRKQAHQVP
jgi:hypothetical protein